MYFDIMYFDYVLLITGALSLLAAIILAFRLFISKKQIDNDKTLILDSDAVTIDLKTLTVKFTQEMHTANFTNTESGTGGANTSEKRISHISSFNGNQQMGDTDEADTAVLDGEEYVDANETDNEFRTLEKQVLENKYTIDVKLNGGGMSKVYLATNNKLGNKWIIKFIDKKTSTLSSEEDILKRLNHTNLPKIVDIFHDESGGTYIVESYIEGVSLDKVIKKEEHIDQNIMLEFAKQLMGVLSYLHKLEPTPIIHCDLKPSNIILTPGGSLVLIDFGISKQGVDDEGIRAITQRYAAPEQFTGKLSQRTMAVVKTRFGELPKHRTEWQIDKRADIYSLGVILFEIATGEIPTVHNRNLLFNAVSPHYADIVLKCLEIEPSARYQTVEEILESIQQVDINIRKIVDERKRKIAAINIFTKIAAVMLVIGVAATTTGGYIYRQENMAILAVDPEMVTVSAQQSSLIQIDKIFTSGVVHTLEASKLKWSTDNSLVAQVDDMRIVGINEGASTLTGKYRNKSISVAVNVVEPLNGIIDISLRYKKGNIIDNFCGSEEREQIDGSIDTAEFVSPTSVVLESSEGTMYVADSKVLRKIVNNQVTTVPFEFSYLVPSTVRCYEDKIYMLSDVWQDDDGDYYYSLVSMSDSGENTELLLTMDAQNTAVPDFDFTQDGRLYFIYKNAQMEQSYICIFDIETKNLDYLCQLDIGVCAMTTDGNKYIYFANEEKGVIQRYDIDTNELIYFAGVEGDRKFIDGSAPLFYQPIKLKMYGGNLYVLDFNVIRKIVIEDSSIYSETVVGEVTPDSFTETRVGPAEDAALEHSKFMDFCIDESGIYITDPKKGVIWTVHN